MSEPVSALGGAVFEGGIARIAEMRPQGMITLRGDISAKAVAGAATGVIPVGLPGPGEANFDGARGIAWMSPDELLLLCPHDAVSGCLDALHKALGKTHALAVDVSDARASFEVSGPHAREVMAKLCPVDLAPGRFEPGMFRRTRMAQVAAAFWMSERDVFRIVCFRSQARYVFDVLRVAAQAGSQVGLFATDI